MSTAAETAHEELQGDLLELSHLVDPSEIITVTSTEYIDNSEPWSAAKNKNPRLVLRPKTVESLSKVVAYLATTNLDYKVRSGGFGSASATDVLISLSAFNDLEFNQDEKYVILGAGANWRSFYQRMDKVAPDWMVVGARTSGVGIGGSTLSAGYSWLSSELGQTSHPSNLLDIKVVTATGEIEWASSDPDLLWAMRGTEGGFAIATHFKFRAHPFPENGKIWCGPIMIPREKLSEAAKGIMSMVEKDKCGELNPKVSLWACMAPKQQLGTATDMLVMYPYDSRGEEKGREAFKWALEIEGAIDQTKGNLTMVEVEAMHDAVDSLRGKAEANWSPLVLSNTGTYPLTESVILNSISWWTDMLTEPSSISQNACLTFELLSFRDVNTGVSSTAWPQPAGFRHILLVGSGCAPGSPEDVREKARRYVVEAPEKILGKRMGEVDTSPACIESYHCVERIYEGHLQRLRRVKGRVDPGNRLKGWIEPLGEGVNGTA